MAKLKNRKIVGTERNTAKLIKKLLKQLTKHNEELLKSCVSSMHKNDNKQDLDNVFCLKQIVERNVLPKISILMPFKKVHHNFPAKKLCEILHIVNINDAFVKALRNIS